MIFLKLLIKVRNLGLIISGLTICAVTVLASLFVWGRDTRRPWADGFFRNVINVIKRHDLLFWMNQVKMVIQDPEITIKFFKILAPKFRVKYVGHVFLKPDACIPMHGVVDDAFHRSRLESARLLDASIISRYGKPIVVREGSVYIVHDGHHRIEIHRALQRDILVELWVRLPEKK